MLKWLETRKRRKEAIGKLDDLIMDLENEMELIGPDDGNYADLADQLEKLYRAKSQIRPNKVSKDALVGGLFSLLQIGAIVGYENRHVITSKAMSFVNKNKVS